MIVVGRHSQLIPVVGVFCIALKENISGQIWVDKFDSGEENTFEYVASSFEEFINNLKTEGNAFL